MQSRLDGLLLALTLSLAVQAAALAQDFLPYEGKNSVREGQGGTKKVVDGIDFWADGAPPRQFKLLGYIEDRRHKTGLVGMIRMSSLESNVAAVAKQNGGDAVILVSSEAETVGQVGNSYGTANANSTHYAGATTTRASGTSTSMSAAVQKQQSKYAVVKYLPDPDPAATGVSATPEMPTPAAGTPSSPSTRN